MGYMSGKGMDTRVHENCGERARYYTSRVSAYMMAREHAGQLMRAR